MKEEGISSPSIRFQPDMEDNDFINSNINTTDSKDDLGGQGVVAQEKVDKGNVEFANAYPDRPLWRGRICNLLNDDLTSFGMAKIVLCLLEKKFDEENLGDINVGISFLLDGDLQMTLFH